MLSVNGNLNDSFDMGNFCTKLPRVVLDKEGLARSPRYQGELSIQILWVDFPVDIGNAVLT